MKLNELRPNPKNPRTITDPQLDALKRSLAEFGDLSGFVFNRRSGQLVGGHQRTKVLPPDAPITISGYVQPTKSGTVADGFVMVDGEKFTYREVDWDETKEKAANLAANKHGGSFDMIQAGEWLTELQEMKFDISLTGFDLSDIPVVEVVGECDEDAVPESVPSVSVLGDVYELGSHRLMCGDSTSIDAVEKLMNNEKADLVHTDPPYNVNYSNQDRPKAGKTDLGRIENDQMSDEKFKEFLNLAFANSYLVAKENSSIYIWYASKETLNFHAAAAAAGWNINQQIIWKKPMLLGRGKYQWAHEPCVFGVKGSPYFTSDRTKTTVWDFGGYDKSSNVHPTQKPVFIPEEAINNSSEQSGLVLDIFGGSGSTLIACEKTKRKCFMMELDPHYVDVIVSRYCKFTGKNKVKRNGEEIEWDK